MPTFEELPNAVKREVTKYSRRGEWHPDPEIAQASLDWAHRMMDGSRASTYGPSVVIDILLSAFSGPGGIASGKSLGDRRVAKRLLRIEQRRSVGDG